MTKYRRQRKGLARESRHLGMVVALYADDPVAGFQHRADTERFLKTFQERLGEVRLSRRYEADCIWRRSVAKPKTTKLGEARNGTLEMNRYSGLNGARIGSDP